MADLQDTIESLAVTVHDNFSRVDDNFSRVYTAIDRMQ